MTTLNCIICDAELESVFGEHTPDNLPYGGTIFTTQGHYGSTVFDPMDESFLEINICDPCLIRAAKKQKVLNGTLSTAKLFYWNPN